jgi:hypothetical protein
MNVYNAHDFETRQSLEWNHVGIMVAAPRSDRRRVDQIIGVMSLNYQFSYPQREPNTPGGPQAEVAAMSYQVTK